MPQGMPLSSMVDTLAGIGPAGRQVVELVEQVFDAEVEAHLLPGVAAAQVDQRVARGLDFVADVRDVVLRLHAYHFDAVVPAAELWVRASLALSGMML